MEFLILQIHLELNFWKNWNLLLIIDNNEKRKGHFFAYDEALETFKVKFIKQNITGNVVNMENLKMQIKLVQTERDRIEILLSEYLNDPTASTRNHAINQSYDTMWNLVKILLQEFDQTNESFLNSNTWKNVYRSQLTVEGMFLRPDQLSPEEANWAHLD
ncbi:hypothetical protein RhiirA5_440746 [Rhizophagus irregularis]|uniref:Uncharacterized protein n=1 Tax=Rhizophagus irregularis TaxID=588596 RepID=A0A2N0NGF0_9GLOM|nr:hypothetical protein RhiirA5_440746 [Rhizophagus irregularis]